MAGHTQAARGTSSRVHGIGVWGSQKPFLFQNAPSGIADCAYVQRLQSQETTLAIKVPQSRDRGRFTGQFRTR